MTEITQPHPMQLAHPKLWERQQKLVSKGYRVVYEYLYTGENPKANYAWSVLIREPMTLHYLQQIGDGDLIERDIPLTTKKTKRQKLPSKPTTPSHRRKHARRQYEERYGQEVSTLEIHEMERIIREEDGHKKRTVRFRDGRKRNVWDVWFRDEWVRVVYDHEDDLIVTCLPGPTIGAMIRRPAVTGCHGLSPDGGGK